MIKRIYTKLSHVISKSVGLNFIIFYFFINNALYLQVLISLNLWLYNFFILSLVYSSFFRLYNSFSNFLILFMISSQITTHTLLSVIKFPSLVIPLWVGTLNIHPPLFYLTFILLFIRFNYVSSWFTNQTVSLKLFNLLFLGLSSLILGGFWGLQSLSWGYFWVNDSVEWVLLFICLLIIQRIHQKITKRIVIYHQLTLYLILTLLLFIRLNLVATRHNFFVTDQFIFSLICLTFMSLYFCIGLCGSYTRFKNLFYLLQIYICVYYLLKSMTVLIDWIPKYITSYSSYLFFNKTGYFTKKFKIFIIHAALIVIFYFWSHPITFFFINYKLNVITTINTLIYQKTLTYSLITYVTNSIGNPILEFVNFIVSYRLFFFTQLSSNLVLNLVFNLAYVLITLAIVIIFVLLKGLNLDFYIKKKHIFKNRVRTKFTFYNHHHSLIQFIYTVKTCRIDLVSIRLFKKCLRRKFIKAKTRFFKPKYWILMMPNFLLTQKSKNSRMGAGVGKFVRLTSIVHSGKSIIKTWFYTYTYLKYLTKYMHFKIPQKFLLKNVKNKKKL